MDLNSVPEDVYEEAEIEIVPSTQISVGDDQASDECEDEDDSSQPNASRKRVLWPETAIEMLVEQYSDIKVNKLQMGNFRSKDYAAIALRLNETINTRYTGKQVKNKVECLVKKYKKEKEKESRTGSTPSEWEFFEQFDAVLDESSKVVGLPGGSTETGFRSGTKRKADDMNPKVAKGIAKTKKFSRPVSIANSQAPVPEYVVVQPQTSKSTPVYVDDCEEDDDEEAGIEVDSPPAKEAVSKPLGKEQKRSASSLRGKKTKARRHEEGTKAAATILAQAMKDVTNVHKELKLMELAQRSEAEDRRAEARRESEARREEAIRRRELLELEASKRKEELQLQLSQLKMQLQIQLHGRGSNSGMASSTPSSNMDNAFFNGGSSSLSDLFDV